MRLNQKRLVREAAKSGFAEFAPAISKDGLSLVRSSVVAPLFEHIMVHLKSAVYADAFLSVSPYPIAFGIISKTDKEFRVFLSPETRYHQQSLSSWDDAKQWEDLFLANLDSLSSRFASLSGPTLIQCVDPIMEKVNGYLNCAGDLFSIFDREFGFMSEIREQDQSIVGRMTTHAGQMMYRRCENTALACHLLLRYSGEVDGIRDQISHPRFYRNEEVAARLHLLIDKIANKRREYFALGGLHRTPP